LRALRITVQSVFLIGTVALLARGLAGATPNTCETYCPFGGLVALYPLARYRAYACALTEFNVALLVSVVLLAIVSKKSFCGWVCPLGTVQEWIGRLGEKGLGRRCRVSEKADGRLRYLRYAVLVAIPVLTYTAWQFDLGFRAYDPFYILFTWGGHETNAASPYIVVGVLVAAALTPLFWCRYLCPLGAALDPFSRAGALRVRRDAETCTDCGLCDKACPHRIRVSGVEQVTASDCTNCLECLQACPEKGTLELSWYGKLTVALRRPKPRGVIPREVLMKKALVIPVAIALLILLAYVTSNAYRVPTAKISFTNERPESVATVVFEVSGLKCRGTANLFAQQIGELPGLVSFVAYARTRTAIVEYDPGRTDPQAIREAFERPVEYDGNTYEVFRALSQESG